MISVIVNPVSGGRGPASAHDRIQQLVAALDASGEAGEVLVSTARGHVRELAAGAVKRGARLVVACGGDGTMNEAASALVFGQVPLAIVPAGSGNGLARELGIALDPSRAIAEAIRAEPFAIDAGELGGHIFFNVAGLGFDAHVAACLDRDKTGRRGLASYVRLGLRETWRYQPSIYTIDGHETARPAILVSLANSAQWGNGFTIAPGAKVNDGQLDLVVVEETNRLATLLALPRYLMAGMSSVPRATFKRLERTTISGAQPLVFHVDGEPAQGGSTLEGRVHPGALRVCVR